MYLTAMFRLTPSQHQSRQLVRILSRWGAAQHAALDRARTRQRELLRCIVRWESKDKKRSKLVVDGKRLHTLVPECVTGYETHLHSTATMSLVVALEEQLASWLGLYIDWIAHGRARPPKKGQRKPKKRPGVLKPAFPTLPPGTPTLAEARYQQALLAFAQTTALEPENAWRAELLRGVKGTVLPMYFGAATSGLAGLGHCGLIRRDDGRLFALLTVWPDRDTEGWPLARARNRGHVGSLANVRGEKPFIPTRRARSSMLVPLEMGHGHEHLFLGRALPKSAKLVNKEGVWFLHVAFQFPDHTPRERSGAVLALRRGITTMVSAVVISREGALLCRETLSGGDLKRLVSEQLRLRRIKQQKGQPTRGDRRAARITEHHLYSAGHQVIDLACRYDAEIVLLADPGARQPQRFLAFRHFHRLGEILTQLAAEAGLPAPIERKLYGSSRTCAGCGWKPGDHVRLESATGEQCAGCGAERDPECHLALLLAHDTLRLKIAKENRPTLSNYFRERYTGASHP